MPSEDFDGKLFKNTASSNFIFLAVGVKGDDKGGEN